MLHAHIFGVITVDVLGATQATKDFVLEETLAETPPFNGFATNQVLSIVKPDARHITSSSPIDGFERPAKDEDGQRVMYALASQYNLVIDEHISGHLLQGTIEITDAWLLELARRIHVKRVLLNIVAEDGNEILSNATKYENAYVQPSWARQNPKPVMATERSSDWRCEYMPDAFDNGEIAFAELLVNLIPGGNSALRELDILAGHKSPAFTEETERTRIAYDMVAEAYNMHERGKLPWTEFED